MSEFHSFDSSLAGGEFRTPKLGKDVDKRPQSPSPNRLVHDHLERVAGRSVEAKVKLVVIHQRSPLILGFLPTSLDRFLGDVKSKHSGPDNGSGSDSRPSPKGQREKVAPVASWLGGAQAVKDTANKEDKKKHPRARPG